jgi:hypothetical protein
MYRLDGAICEDFRPDCDSTCHCTQCRRSGAACKKDATPFSCLHTPLQYQISFQHPAAAHQLSCVHLMASQCHSCKCTKCSISAAACNNSLALLLYQLSCMQLIASCVCKESHHGRGTAVTHQLPCMHLMASQCLPLVREAHHPSPATFNTMPTNSCCCCCCC